MLDATREFLSWWFSATWQLFGITVPGFTFSFGTLLLAIILISAGIDVVYLLLGFGSGGVGYRSGSSGKAHGISDRRKHDEY